MRMDGGGATFSNAILGLEEAGGGGAWGAVPSGVGGGAIEGGTGGGWTVAAWIFGGSITGGGAGGGFGGPGAGCGGRYLGAWDCAAATSLRTSNSGRTTLVRFGAFCVASNTLGA